ncbi:hypothetical protein OIU77_026427 [Salix suchowensis]|uniref:Uncharacterized protein n=1 Tax=Salix suchowensis TaxID=1278906 RepID=A0ABQ9BNU9_9ROSI|nr:hypothetical protein OIU77_026427 [Salix suchowensis]
MNRMKEMLKKLLNQDRWKNTGLKSGKKKDYSTMTLEQKKSPSHLAVDKAINDDNSVMSNSTSKKKRMLMQEVVQSDPLRFFGGAITSSRLLSAAREENPNATVFGYGDPGSEKTYTMQGTNLLPRPRIEIKAYPIYMSENRKGRQQS